MRSGFTHIYAEPYVERFTVTACMSKKLVITAQRINYASDKSSGGFRFALSIVLVLFCPLLLGSYSRVVSPPSAVSVRPFLVSILFSFEA